MRMQILTKLAAEACQGRMAQHNATHYNALQHTAAHCIYLSQVCPPHSPATDVLCCSVLQCVAVCCSVLQCVVVYCHVMQCDAV